jgi:hypothetical protein
LGVIGIHTKRRGLQTARRIPMLVRIAFAGEKRYGVSVREGAFDSCEPSTVTYQVDVLA